MKDKTYIPINGFVIPAYLYTEGNDKEQYWVDTQQLYVCLDDYLNEIDKDWWVISPFKPKGEIVTDKNQKELVKWCVYESSINDDFGKKWDFENHKPININ